MSKLASAAAWVCRCAAVATLAGTLLLIAPLGASAHAELLASRPANNERLGLAPATVVLDFSEPLYPALSDATVADPSGHIVTASPASASEIRVNLLTNLPGTYRVTWAAVSATDSHATQGSFTFVVEAPLPVTAASESSGPTALDVVVALGRWIEDAYLLLVVGMLAMAWLARRGRSLEWVRPRLLSPMVVALAAGIVVIIGEAVTAAGFNVSGVVTYFAAWPSGISRILRVLFETLACLACATRVRALWLALPGALIALSVSGHAPGGHPPWLSVVIDALHLLAAGVWVGGIMAMATLRPPGGWRASGRELVTRFTPWALLGFATSVLLGAIQAISNVGDASALVTTAYGRVLVAKAFGVVGLIPLSLLAWRRRRAHVRAEALIAVAVVGAAALLAAFPVPARSVTSPAVAFSATASGLPGGHDLTFGGQAGQTLVGLSIDPALPGMNHVTVFFIGSDGAAASRGVDVTAVMSDRQVPLISCGVTCRRAAVALRGGEAVSIRVAGAQGGTAHFRLPALPTTDGSALLRTALARMGRLRSVSLRETLTGGAGTTIITTYEEAAPDLLAWAQPDGSATIVVGATRYTRRQADDRWTIDAGNPKVVEPAFSWTLFSPEIGAHVVGTAVVGNVHTTVVGFFAGASVTPVWFRLYIDESGLVRRADMAAPGHFMTQTFSDFDAPLSIVPPGVAGTSSAAAT